MSQYLRKILLGIPPYISGRSIDSIKNENGLSKIYKLASNENPLGPSPKAVKAIKKYLKNIHRYPDPDANRLKKKLAEKLNLAPENFLIGNGAAEIIDLIALAFIDPDDEVLLSYPTFPKYYLSTKRLLGKVINIPMKDFQHDYHSILNHITPKTKLIFIDTPSNPVGSKLGRSEQQFILDKLPDHVVLILDEAYREFIDEHDCLNYHEVLPQRKNVLLLRTLSKDYGLSGLRIGYLIGHPDTIADVNRLEDQLNLNPNDSELLLMLGITYHDEAQTGDKIALDRCEEIFNTLIQKEPENSLALACLGSILTMRGDWEKLPNKKLKYVHTGIEKIDKAVFLEPENLMIRLVRAMNSLKLPSFFYRLKFSLEDFSFILNSEQFSHWQSENKAMIYYHCGIAWEKDENMAEARKYFETAIQIAPQSAWGEKAKQDLNGLK